jgi:arginine-tRNA-protein transferase
VTTRGGISLYRSVEHICAYLPERLAATAFVDPNQALSPALYGRLLQLGFRRSGALVYRPACPVCRACVSARIPVREIRPRRSQRRAWQASRDRLEVVSRPPGLDPAHFDLYQRYLEARHPEGTMTGGEESDYAQFLFAPWCDTELIELRLAGRLLAVAVTDRVPDGLSAVYTFFDPDLGARSPGMLAILAQVDLARRRGLDWLYLGYWIGSCRKMRYKADYRPLELLIEGAWQRFGAGDALPHIP